MMKTRILWPTLLLAGLCPAAAAAQDDDPVTLPACGRPVPLTRALLQGAEFAGGGPVLIGTLAGPGFGTVAFVRRGGAWRAYAIESGGRTQGVFRSPRGDVFAWSMLSTEGPGASWQGLSIAAAGARFCTAVDFPKGLNQPTWANEYLDLKRFNIDRSSRAVLIGAAEVERDGRSRTWTYRYVSRDRGRHWSTPVRVTAAPVPAGDWHRVGAAPTALVRSLRAAAR